MRQSTHRLPLAGFVILLAALASSPTRADVILETATLGPNPVASVGLGGLQWFGARFSLTQAVTVDHVGANIDGNSSIFAAIVALSGPGGLPTFAPSEIESNALASTTFVLSPGIADVSVPLSVLLGPGDYGVLFGVGPFGSSGGANLTGGHVPTSQASFFSALPLNGDIWLDRPTDSGLRIFVTGTPVVPEPSSLAIAVSGMLALAAISWRRRAAAARG